MDLCFFRGLVYIKGLIKGRLFVCFNEKVKFFIVSYLGLRMIRYFGF